jgi:hypothetical protein
MEFKITINEVSTVNEITSYWNNEDYKKLLEMFEFPEVETIQPENLKEMLFMAITDFEPNTAANKLLTYKLSDQLGAGQIDQISNDMLVDKMCEECPEIELHYTLFNINQLLFKAYNGKFPNAKATIVDFTITAMGAFEDEITKDVVLKSFSNGISDTCVIKRLFDDQLISAEPFEQAESILWELNKTGDNQFTLITSEYWLNKEYMLAAEFTGEYPEPSE